MPAEIDVAALRTDPRVIWAEDVLRFGDADMNGHINNSTYSVLAESGRVTLFRTQLGEGRDPESYFVIVKLTIEFRSELHYPGRIRTGTWIGRLGRTSIGLSQVIIADDDEIAATCDAVCVSMSRRSRRPEPFTETTRRAAERLLRPAA